LGAGVQSTTIYLAACEGRIPTFDAAIFADTGWEPARVYQHLARLEAHGKEAGGPPIYRVSAGNIRDDALDPEHRFASMPLFVRNPDGSEGMVRRQCTSEYKLKPIKAKVRELLGYPHPKSLPRGLFAEVAIGISTDEIGRARDSDVGYMRNVFPLLDLGMDRKACERYLTEHGWIGVPKSACIGCPFHGNRQWREMRDQHPDEWADAAEFDQAIRGGSARATARGKDLRGQMFLHRSRVPLDEAPIDHVTRAEWKNRQGDLFEDGDPDGCSPWVCRSGETESSQTPAGPKFPGPAGQTGTGGADVALGKGSSPLVPHWPDAPKRGAGRHSHCKDCRKTTRKDGS
jgi:hypothetical protein